MKDNGIKFVRREGAEKHLDFRVSEWLDTDLMEPKFGVQAQVQKGQWCHIAYQGSPLIFRDKIDAKFEVKRLKALRVSSSQAQ